MTLDETLAVLSDEMLLAQIRSSLVELAEGAAEVLSKQDALAVLLER